MVVNPCRSPLSRRIACDSFCNSSNSADASSQLVPSLLSSFPPTLYILNASSIVKPDAFEQLTTDLQENDIDIAIISESHLKKKHISGCINIEGYELFRRDRNGQEGGGVAIFSRQLLTAAIWPTPGIDPVFELMWI